MENLELKLINLSDFQILSKIGEGSSCIVYKIKKNKTKCILAAKVFYNNNKLHEEMLNISREININASISHPLFLKFIGYSPKDFNNESNFVIVTEYLKEGSLFSLLENERKSMAPITWDDTKKLITIFGIASGMSFLHLYDILHRDLKPSNILMDDDLFPKIADFGFSKKEFNEQNSVQSFPTLKGTRNYLAPEIIKNNNYTKSGDVYAFGILVYEIVTGQIAYSELNYYDILSNVVKGYRPIFKNDVPEAYRNLIQKCWENELNKRTSFEEIVNELKSNPDFILPSVNENDFMYFVDRIEENNNISFIERKVINIEDYMSLLQKTFKNIKEFDLSKFQIIKILKKSSYCETSLAQSEKETIIIKRFTPCQNDEIDEKKFIKHIQNLFDLQLIKFCIKFKGISFHDINGKFLEYPLIIKNFAVHGSLQDLIDNTGISDSLKMIVLYGVAKGMMELHEKNHIFHNNLNPMNILLDENNHPLLSDFRLNCEKQKQIYNACQIIKGNFYRKIRCFFIWNAHVLFINFKISNN